PGGRAPASGSAGRPRPRRSWPGEAAPAAGLVPLARWRTAARGRGAGEPARRALCLELAHVIGRAEDPLERVVVALGRPAAKDVVAHMALQPVGDMEDLADEAVRGDLHARRAHQAPFLVVAEGAREISIRGIGADAQAH